MMLYNEPSLEEQLEEKIKKLDRKIEQSSINTTRKDGHNNFNIGGSYNDLVEKRRNKESKVKDNLNNGS